MARNSKTTTTTSSTRLGHYHPCFIYHMAPGSHLFLAIFACTHTHFYVYLCCRCVSTCLVFCPPTSSHGVVVVVVVVCLTSGVIIFISDAYSAASGAIAPSKHSGAMHVSFCHPLSRQEATTQQFSSVIPLPISTKAMVENCCSSAQCVTALHQLQDCCNREPLSAPCFSFFLFPLTSSTFMLCVFGIDSELYFVTT